MGDKFTFDNLNTFKPDHFKASEKFRLKDGASTPTS